MNFSIPVESISVVFLACFIISINLNVFNLIFQREEGVSRDVEVERSELRTRLSHAEHEAERANARLRAAHRELTR